MNTRRWGVVLWTVFGLFHAAAFADDSAPLKYKLAKGDKLIYRSKSEMKQTQTFAGMTIENEMTNDSISSYTVDGVDEQGNFQMTVKAERLKVKATVGPLGDFEFDSQSSERDKSSIIGAALTPLYERMSGLVFQAKISPLGEVLEVKGYAEQLKDILANNPLGSQFSGGGTDEAAKQSLKELFVKLPGKSLQPGDSWDTPSEVDLPNIGKTKSKSSYRYTGTEKINGRDAAKFEVTNETSVSLDIDQGGAKITGTISSTGATGIIHFDLETGRIVRVTGNATLGGDLSIDANGMIIPLRNDQTVKATIEWLEKLPD